MFVSIIETVILPVGFGFLLNYLYGKKKMFHEIQQMMPGVAVLGLACVVGGVVSSQGSKFFQSGVVIFVAVLLHNGLGYLFGCRKTGRNEHIQKENDSDRSRNAERRTRHKSCYNDSTVRVHTGVSNHLCSFLYMAFYLRNITCRNVCNV